MKRIAVVGSINIDYFVESNKLPKFGETVMGNNFFMDLGGKGANQAVAVARLGGDVTLFGSIGNDEQRVLLINHFQNEKVGIDHLNVVEGVSTGAAFIQLFHSENRIIIVPGANEYTNANYSKKIKNQLLQYDVFLFQLEIPIETLEFLIPILHEHNKTIILDPAPAEKLDKDLLDQVTYLTPNEHEFATVLGHEEKISDTLIKYPNKVIVTCGEKGVVYHNGNKIVTIPARKVKAIDTTGAGDTFTGAFTVAVSKGKPLEECIQYGVYAASLSVMKKGAQAGMPFHDQLETVEG
ncbi:ribokinase [Radiobacillus sp. PE A8.2]|uniref:ribokinase n=1 Tax=Radiobacillus sp. PE A8.2 TaxID=3380349 RepID=UPI00388D18D7